MGITTRFNHLLENITESLCYNTVTPVIFIDFLQAFDMLWHQGLVLKLHRLQYPKAYLYWIVNFFTSRTMLINYDEHFSSEIKICRGAPQRSVFGLMAYIMAHYDLPQIFGRPENVHLYIDDLAIAYIPSIHVNRRRQIRDIERLMNDNMEKLYIYAAKWHQPVNVSKTEYVIYHRAVQSPTMKIVYDGTIILKKTSYKYLGSRIDDKRSFRHLISDQMIKLRRTYMILKHTYR